MPSDCPALDAASTLGEQLGRATESFQAGRLWDAEQHCGAVLDHAPGHAGARRQLGLIRLVRGDPVGCQALLLPLRETFADDPDVAIAIAEASWATSGASTAIPHYRHALALAPGRVRARARLGLALLTAGEPAAARQELEAVIRAEPDANALTHFGMALIAEGQPHQAIPVLLRSAQLDQHEPGSVFHLGQALRELGRIDDAVFALTEAVRRGPDQAHLHLALGDALFARGDHARGKAALRQATALDPAQPLAWAKLGDMEQLTGDAVTALSCYRCAVDLDETNPDLLALLGNALLSVGDPAGGDALGRSMAARWTKPRPKQLHIGILAAPGTANTPTGFIIDRTRFAASPVFMVDGLDYPCGCLAETYDVLFNAVSDPDAAPHALALATRLAPAVGLPVVNPPLAMPGTTRERMAARLAGIPGLHVPRTVRCDRAGLAGLEWSGPVLVRGVSSHGGKDLAVAHTAEELRQAASSLSCDEIYVTEFVDFRSGGGLYRKLRIVFVDGQPYPVHLAIGDHWLSHYFRTPMADRPDWRAEEAAFLAGHEAYLGRGICLALGEVQARVGLDFFGIDGAIGPDGRLLMFECNASMLVRHADRPAMFDYKRAPAERIRGALGDLLRRLAA